MARRVRAFDWGATPLGPIDAWPRSLKTVAEVCLRSRFQMAIYWGPELVCIYNDAERDVLGQLHPGALGQPARELLVDSWDVLAPQLRSVMEDRQSMRVEDEPLRFDRRGVLEVGYFTYSYSPVPDDDGGVGGVLLVSEETTAHVLAERRIDVVRDVASASMDARSEGAACSAAAGALEGRADIPFSLIYLIDGDGAHARCAAASGLSGSPVLELVAMARGNEDGPAAVFRRLERRRAGGAIAATRLFFGERADRSTRPARTFVTWIGRGSKEPVLGFLVAGINDDLAFDDAYRGFLETVGLGVGRGIAAARERDAERERARDLAALDSARVALFSNASHELKTPLALILGSVDELLEQQALAPPAIDAAGTARRSAQRMLKLVNGLLDVSRIEAGEQIGVFQPTDLAGLTGDVTAMFRSTAERAGIELTVDCPPLTDPVHVDREAWERIVSNLLSNAVKFTTEGGISVRLRGESDHAALAVEDTGIGVPAKDLQRIFSRFYRVADPRARTSEGTGIGLALVSKLVLLHGGSVEAESRLGGGTRMTVRIPTGSAHLPAGAHGPEAPAVGTVGRAAEAFVAEAEGWLGGDRAGREPPGADGGRVLVVDDNADMRAYLRRLLAPHYAVETAANGSQALELAIADPPTVIISDVMLPGLDGVGLLRALRRDARVRDTPVILVSARTDRATMVRAFELGADDYIVKPFGARELVARIRASVDGTSLRSRTAEARGRHGERALKDRELRVLLDDLKAAQRRGAEAGDAARRRIERDLHDGAQQRLMAMRLELSLVMERLEADPAAARADLDRLRGDLDDALDELRELAHGLYPPLLASDGLPAALAAACRRAPVPVEFEQRGIRRLEPAIESAAYFCCVEALQNVAKHAGASARASVRLALRDGALEFSVRDDGAGFDAGAVSDGNGLTNLHDRLAALGGHAEIESAPGAGTTISGHIPLS